MKTLETSINFLEGKRYSIRYRTQDHVFQHFLMKNLTRSCEVFLMNIFEMYTTQSYPNVSQNYIVSATFETRRRRIKRKKIVHAAV